MKKSKNNHNQFGIKFNQMFSEKGGRAAYIYIIYIYI